MKNRNTCGTMVPMAADEDVVALAKSIVRQAVLLNAAIQQLGDQAVLLEACLVRCDLCKLNPATVLWKNSIKDFHACDRCAAERVVKKMMTEEQWVDLQDAARTRRVIDYVCALRLPEAQQDTVH